MKTLSEFYKAIENKGLPTLRGQGKVGGLVFIGTNPSVRSKLKNLWDDPYGIYFGGFLKEAGIDPEEIYVSNLYKHPTPENRPLFPQEVLEGWNELVVEIGLINPKIIIALGKQTMDCFGVKHGELKNWKSTRVYGLYHPAYINKNLNTLKVDYITHLKRIKKLWTNQ